MRFKVQLKSTTPTTWLQNNNIIGISPMCNSQIPVFGVPYQQLWYCNVSVLNKETKNQHTRQDSFHEV